MINFQSKFNEIAPTQVRPPKSTIFPDHPHPTMLVEGGQEPGDGPGWKNWKIKKNKEEGNKGGRCKTKQRGFYQIGNESLDLSFEVAVIFGRCVSDRSFEKGLPDRILFDPYDESSRSGYSRRGWDCHNWQPAILCVALTRDFYQQDQITNKITNSNHEPKEVPL